MIYAGQGDLSGTLFRVSTMGELTAADMMRLLASFARKLQGAERVAPATWRSGCS